MFDMLRAFENAGFWLHMIGQVHEGGLDLEKIDFPGIPEGLASSDFQINWVLAGKVEDFGFEPQIWQTVIKQAFDSEVFQRCWLVVVSMRNWAEWMFPGNRDMFVPYLYNAAEECMWKDLGFLLEKEIPVLAEKVDSFLSQFMGEGISEISINGRTFVQAPFEGNIIFFDPIDRSEDAEELEITEKVLGFFDKLFPSWSIQEQFGSLRAEEVREGLFNIFAARPGESQFEPDPVFLVNAGGGPVLFYSHMTGEDGYTSWIEELGLTASYDDNKVTHFHIKDGNEVEFIVANAWFSLLYASQEFEISPDIRQQIIRTAIASTKSNEMPRFTFGFRVKLPAMRLFDDYDHGEDCYSGIFDHEEGGFLNPGVDFGKLLSEALGS